ncbi:flagellar hook-associated protein FlgK [Thioalkalivibrio halophilus]|uniref:Flagellar hook-associated protein 1 n=1 Tax=Thioalkalivibrio halophilus TaxID=252474 RepID=A0A1V3A2C6_9GAMM|nr:flagellar hook-associated protein FlgK [Thioalkalivibrio halophilus]OOC11494.1 flagellar hook-associated protein FlgK [Thioalkalivibrio halophilus]
MSSLNIGTSGLLAYQRAISTTSNNIANASTEGYSRQSTSLANRPPQFLGGNFQGQGVEVDNVRRISDQFVNNQLRDATSENANAETRVQIANRIDNLLADEASGLQPVLQSFFDAAQDVSSDPTSSAAREVFRTEAESLVERLGSIDSRLQEQRQIVNGQIETGVQEVNDLADALADVNRAIVSGSTQGTPNDLLDQRDRLINDLAEKVDVRTVEQDDGALNVFVGNGQALVLGGDARELRAEPLSGDPERLDIGVASGDGTASISRFIRGGELGGLLEMRGGMLDEAQNTLGQIAHAVGESFNEQNRRGLDLNGEQGEAIFGLGEPRVWGAGDPKPESNPEVSIADAGALTTNDYRLRRDENGDYELRRLPDNRVIDDDDYEIDDVNDEIRVDGMVIDVGELEDDGVTGEWLIQPTRSGASQMEVLMQDGDELAAAAALRAREGDGNQGDATVSSIAATDPDSEAFDGSIDGLEVSFNGTDFERGDGGTIDMEEVDDGVYRVSGDGWEMEVRGTPEDGDTFQVFTNENREGDNRNMQAMNALAEEDLVEGRRNFGDAYNSLIASVGTQTRQAQVAEESASAQLDQAREQREAVSGVNLDEEAADLLRYQQAYQASAQVIQIGNSLFDSLLGAVRG